MTHSTPRGGSAAAGSGAGPASDQPPLISDYADDPDMVDLVEMFVEEMPRRVSAFESALRAADLEVIRRLAHQLKGAAGGYGFDSITHAAARVEQDAKSTDQLTQIKASIDELLSLCRRAAVGPDGERPPV